MLSCEGDDCPPLYESSFLPIVSYGLSGMCGFECAVGQKMCDEFLNPYSGFFPPHYYEEKQWIEHSKCSRSAKSHFEEIERMEYKEKGIKYVTITLKDTETNCQETREYAEICEDINCKLVETGHPELTEYKKKVQLKRYEESCFIATEADCQQIAFESRQCIRSAIQSVKEFFCASSDLSLGRYRKQRLTGDIIDMVLFGFGKKPKHSDSPPAPTSTPGYWKESLSPSD